MTGIVVSSSLLMFWTLATVHANEEGSFGYDCSHFQYCRGSSPSGWDENECKDYGDSFYPQSKADCLADGGGDPGLKHSFAIFLGQTSAGVYFKGLKEYTNQAMASGIPANRIGVYIWDDAKQHSLDVTRATIRSILENEVDFGRIWLDIEAPDRWCGKGTACSEEQQAENVEYIIAMRGVIEDEFNIPVGIYAGQNAWRAITGIGYGGRTETNPFADLPYWWARFDRNPGFDKYLSDPLPGWDLPAIHQYVGSEQNCRVTIDWNYSDKFPTAPARPYCRHQGSMAIEFCDSSGDHDSYRYLVRYGESLQGVADCFGLDLEALAQVNSLSVDAQVGSGAELMVCL